MRMVKKILQRVAAIVAICFMAVGGLAVVVPAAHAATATQRDCDDNAVIRCGITSLQDLKAKYNQNQGGNVKQIFAHYSIKSAAALDGMVAGRVTKNGDVFVGNTKVANRANSAGRQNLPGSTKIPNVNAYMRPTTVSFRSDSLDAFAQMKDGKFRFAVIKACGNPVQAFPVTKPSKPTKPKPLPGKPNLTIKKDVRVLGNSEFEPSVEADPGDELQYRVTIENFTSKVDVKNLHIQDSLPQGLTYEDGNLEGSQEVAGFKISDLVGEGINVATLPKDRLLEITFVVKVGDSVDACEVPLRNVAFVEADNVPEKQGEALTKVCQPETPVAPTTPEQPQQSEQPQEQTPQVLGVQTLTAAGPAGLFGAFSATSLIGFAAYKLKDFYLAFLR
jgi:uncharacterized repeat protein (TIGR01451 family)